MLEWTHYIPIFTTLVAIAFSTALYRHWRKKPTALYLLWWLIGVAMYGIGTLTESLNTLLGWNPIVLKVWYISGALLGAAPLAQGTVYLMLKKKSADTLALIVTIFTVIAAICIVLTPIDTSLVSDGKLLTGKVFVWSWVRLFSPFLNTYALIFLVGGAARSAWEYFRKNGYGSRVLGNVLIAAGALLPGIGGSFTRFGFVEALYVTEILGLTLIWWGYRAMSGTKTTSIYAAQQAAAGK
ncbi:MAG: hypothetical protein OHK0031_13480 [Anaerolineales bacterium]